MHEMVKQTQDRLDLRSQILTVFMPGRDSTGYALSNVFHVLARRLDIHQQLRSEVLRTDSEPLTFEYLRSLKYVQWVFNEGMASSPEAVSRIESNLHFAHRSSRTPDDCAGAACLLRGHHPTDRRRRRRPSTHLRAQGRPSDG